MARAMALHEQERKLGGSQLLEGEKHELPANLPRGAIVVERARVLPPLITLSAYVHRGNALCYKRLTGLSNFDVWVLSEIGLNAPLGWPQLVQALLRDQSQAGRTVRRLIELGLIERSGAPGRRNGFFSLTKEGERAHALIHDVGDRRNASLLQDIDPQRLATFFAAFETLARNVEAQLAREHALEEIEPD
jgi:DNA-binding MarR family transcriptional regulator